MRRVAVAAAVLVLAGCRPESARIDPALATLAPADAVLLAGIRLDKLRQTPVWQKHLENRDLPFIEAAARETGIDLKRHVWEILIVSNGSDVVAYARGNFTTRGTEPPTREHVRRIPYKGYTLLGSDRATIAFLSPSVAVAGASGAVMAAIDQKGRTTGPPRALAKLVRTIPPENQVWAAARGGTVPDLPGNAANLAKALSLAETLTVAADFGAGLKLRLETTGRSDQDAQSLYDALRGIVGFARLMTRDRDLARTLDGAPIAREGRKVGATLTLNEDQTARLLGQALPPAR